MNQKMLREDFLASFQRLQQQFDSSLEEAKALDNKFATHYQQFHSNLWGLLAEARSKVPESSPLSQSLTEFVAGLETLDTAWKIRLENQDKGLRFRKNFEDSLLVYVYGKVKSGKSSLGNYMAWGYTDPTAEQQGQMRNNLSYGSHINTDAENGDAQNEAVLQKKFRVGATEATSSIQSFRLPGLTWVDSPGLHSVRMQNGELAKEHADHADLILYTMKSDAPGRASDLEEIRALCVKEKNILLLLTGSDKKEHGWDDEKDEVTELCVMKSPADRQLQRNYVKKELQEAQLDTSNVALLSVSARYAELNSDNPQAIEESGMGKLFATLHQISQDRGVRIKRAVPMTNFKNFLNGCIEEVVQYHTLIGSFTQDLDHVGKRVPQQAVPEIREAQSAMRSTIHAEFDTLASGRDDEHQLNAALKKAKTRWDEKMAALVNAAMENILSDVMKNFKSAVTSTWNASSLSLPTFSVQKVTEQIPDGYSKGTRSRNSGLGGLIGGALGLFLGPVGMAVGATIGAGLGSALGQSSQQSMRTIEIAVGDNLNEVRFQMVDLYLQGIEKEIQYQIDTLFSTLLTEMSASCATLNDEIKNFELVLIKLRDSAESKLISEVH
ncbi:dynamin family protein [Pseudomonas graminis]